MADTNILGYVFDHNESIKRNIADTLITGLIRKRCLVLSAQALNEFYTIATHPKKALGMTHEEAANNIRNFANSCQIVPLTAATTLLALNAMPLYRFHYWDALIWAAAKENGIATIYTEDVPSTPIIEGVRYINPFAQTT